MNEPILMHPDIDESTEVRDICDVPSSVMPGFRSLTSWIPSANVAV